MHRRPSDIVRKQLLGSFERVGDFPAPDALAVYLYQRISAGTEFTHQCGERARENVCVERFQKLGTAHFATGLSEDFHRSLFQAVFLVLVHVLLLLQG